MMERINKDGGFWISYYIKLKSNRPIKTKTFSGRPSSSLLFFFLVKKRMKKKNQRKCLWNWWEGQEFTDLFSFPVHFLRTFCTFSLSPYLFHFSNFKQDIKSVYFFLSLIIHFHFYFSCWSKPSKQRKKLKKSRSKPDNKSFKFHTN